MKVNEIRDLSAEELNQKLASLKEELFNLRFQLATGQLDNPMRIKEVKKTIARIKTIQTEGLIQQRTILRIDMQKEGGSLMSERNERKTKVGKVVSDKMDKTVVVAVLDLEQHALYKKAVKKTVKFKAHDENNDAHVGDTVSIMETRPLSKDKRWRVVEIVERAK